MPEKSKNLKKPEFTVIIDEATNLDIDWSDWISPEEIIFWTRKADEEEEEPPK